MKKVLIFPGAGQYVRNYGSYDGVEIWLAGEDTAQIPVAEWYVGHSLGISFMLAHCGNRPDAKFILINPLLPQRNVFRLLWRWIRFFIGEGIQKQKRVAFRHWPRVARVIGRLIRVDVWEAIHNIPKEKITIIRGTRDSYFCDAESDVFLRSAGMRVLNADAGHDWNEAIARTVTRITEGRDENVS